MKKFFLQTLFLLSFFTSFAQKWEDVTTPSTSFQSLENSIYANGNTVMYVDNNNAYISNDAGKTWKLIPATYPKYVFANSKKLFVGALNNVYASSDNGKTWISEYNSGADDYVILDDEVFIANDFYGVIKHNNTTGKWENTGLITPMSDILTDGKALYAIGNNKTKRSFDKGKTWINYTWTANQPSEMGVFKGVTYGGGLNFGIQSTKDSCKTWNSLGYTGAPNSNSHTNNFVGIDDSLYVSYDASAFGPAVGVYRYDLQTKSWSERNNGLVNKNIVRIAYNGNGTLWGISQESFGTTGKVHKMTIGKKVTAKDVQFLSNVISIAPNPATSFIALNMNNEDNKEKVTKVEIFDVQGKLYTSMNQFVSLISTEQMPKGMYFLKCNFEEKTTIEKFIIE